MVSCLFLVNTMFLDARSFHVHMCAIFINILSRARVVCLFYPPWGNIIFYTFFAISATL